MELSLGIRERHTGAFLWLMCAYNPPSQGTWMLCPNHACIVPCKTCFSCYPAFCMAVTPRHNQCFLLFLRKEGHIHDDFEKIGLLPKMGTSVLSFSSVSCDYFKKNGVMSLHGVSHYRLLLGQGRGRKCPIFTIFDTQPELHVTLGLWGTFHWTVIFDGNSMVSIIFIP